MKTLVALALGIVAAALLATSAGATTPTPVLLGTADQFAVLAGGGLTNVLVTTVTGDVGSSATPSQTGFTACPGAADCVALTGANHTDPAPNDAVTQSAKSSLTTAYGNAAGQTPTQIPTELAGTTLTAGVYDSAAGTFGMTGTLVLDGANNADSIFIFQTASTLTTGGTGNVTFIRGAQACNVFWKVGSSATLGAGSSFSGTILAHDSISLGDGVTVHGRLLADAGGGTGAVTLIHDTIARPTSCTTQASIDAAAAASQAAAAAAAAAASAQAAAAAQAAAVAQAEADRAAAAAKAADEKAAADAAAKAAAAAAAAAQAATDAAAAVEKAAADAAAAAVAKQAAAKAATSARKARAAAIRARTAKAKAARLATARAVARKQHAVRAAKVHPGFTG